MALTEKQTEERDMRRKAGALTRLLKSRTRSATAYAIRTGKLVRGECEFCGSTPTHAHHGDYTMPRTITWLCAPCHFDLHAWWRVLHRIADEYYGDRRYEVVADFECCKAHMPAAAARYGSGRHERQRERARLYAAQREAREAAFRAARKRA